MYHAPMASRACLPILKSLARSWRISTSEEKDPPVGSSRGSESVRPTFAQRPERPREGGAWLVIVALAAAFPIYWGFQRLTASEEGKQVSDAAQDRADFLSVADDYAATLFSEQRWEEAARAYRVVRERYLEANDGNYDEPAAALLFNEAASELNRGRDTAARELLLELESKVPSYRPEEISTLIREATERSQMERYQQLVDAASAVFEQSNWTETIRLYQDVLDHLRSMGYSEKDDLFSQSQYDLAMAYGNNEQYADAEELLSGIRTANPSYDSARIDEQHRRVTAILQKR